MPRTHHVGLGWVSILSPKEVIRPRRDVGDVGDRRWHSIEIDLSPQAGRATDLRFTITVDGLYEEATNLAGWREPGFFAASPNDS
jgi:hypothetical protein